MIKQVIARTNRLYRSPVSLWFRLLRILSYWRRLALRFQVRVYGAKLIIGNNIDFQHPTEFQGYGTLVIEDNVSFGYILGGSRLLPILLQPREASSIIQLGKGTILMNGSEIMARTKILIGERCLIGPRCIILDSDFHGIQPQKREDSGSSSEVIIGNNVWIGSDVTILKGVHIGQDSVIGARSVVTNNLGDGVIAVGNPARVIRSVYV